MSHEEGLGRRSLGGRYESDSRPPTSLEHEEIRPPAESLSRVKEEDLAMLISMRRPPELVKRVFSALMIMVSPFVPTHVDISWVAVQEWVKEVGTIKAFMNNLSAFDASMVPAQNPERTAAFMRQSGLSREKLLPISESLANLSDWLIGLCIESGSVVGFLRDVGDENTLDNGLQHTGTLDSGLLSSMNSVDTADGAPREEKGSPDGGPS